MADAQSLQPEHPVQARAEMLLRLLMTRFGAVPEPAAARIRGARPEELNQWADAALSAETLAEVFGES